MVRDAPGRRAPTPNSMYGQPASIPVGLMKRRGRRSARSSSPASTNCHFAVGQAAPEPCVCCIGLAAWALGEGIALDAELLLDPDTVERFVTQGLNGDHSRATYRAVLRRIGPLLTRRAPWEPRPALMARRQVARPYTTSEMETLIADAGYQSTQVRIR